MPRYTGPPMDLTNMRSLGVTAVDVYCKCGHQSSVDVFQLPGDLAVPEIKHRNGLPFGRGAIRMLTPYWERLA
jgi:hypothetical protein